MQWITHWNHQMRAMYSVKPLVEILPIFSMTFGPPDGKTIMTAIVRGLTVE
jgi:hypothetical protein